MESTHIAQLEAVQRRAARSVTKDYRRTSSVTAMLTQLEWKSLCERRAQTRAILCYKIVHGLIDIPSNPYFVINNNPTRGHHSRYIVPHFRISAYKFSFFPATIRIWNDLPVHTIMSPSIESFRTRLAALQLVV